VMLFALGAFDMVSVIIRGTLVQMNTPPEMRGRVSATVRIRSYRALVRRGARRRIRRDRDSDGRRPVGMEIPRTAQGRRSTRQQLELFLVIQSAFFLARRILRLAILNCWHKSRTVIPSVYTSVNAFRNCHPERSEGSLPLCNPLAPTTLSSRPERSEVEGPCLGLCLSVLIRVIRGKPLHLL
jgi:hypothetical protein